MNNTISAIPGYRTGTWTVDPVHSEVGFAVRHLLVSKVRGRFRDFTARIVTAPDFTKSTVIADIDLASVDTGNERRDNHLRSAEFFDVARFPTMHFEGHGLRHRDDGWRLDGELTLKGVTRELVLTVEINGFAEDPNGNPVSGFTATGVLNRRDFGVDFDAPLPGGGTGIADLIAINLEVEALKDR